jgi:hypothetical protein
MQNSFTLHCVTWQFGAPKLEEARMAACMLGLLSPAEAEAEDLDERSYHALALNESGKAIGCARITPDGEVERMVVLSHDNQKQIESALNLAAWLHENNSSQSASQAY